MALQVRMGAYDDETCGLRSSVASVPRAPDQGLDGVPIKVFFSRAGADVIHVRVKTSLTVKHAVFVNPGG